MAFKREKKEGRIILKIEGAMTVCEAASIRGELSDCLKKSKGLILELDDVGDCDTAGVQLLCSAQRTAGERDKTFSVVGASTFVMDAVTRSGFDPEEVFAVNEEV